MGSQMKDPIEFWYEFGSTYSYLSVMRIAAVAEAAGAEVIWRPFLLGPIFADQGWNDSPFNLYPAKGRYMWRDLERLIEDAQVLAEILSDLNRDPAAILESSNSSANKERLRCQTEEAKRRGIFGAPSFTVGDELFWGNDPLGTAVAWSLGLR